MCILTIHESKTDLSMVPYQYIDNIIIGDMVDLRESLRIPSSSKSKWPL